jgi:hypothetical protein
VGVREGLGVRCNFVGVGIAGVFVDVAGTSDGGSEEGDFVGDGSDVRGSSELEWDPEHIFFKTFDGPYRLDNWEAPKQSGVYAVLHKTTSDEGPITYIIDYCGQGRNLSSYRGYPWIHHRIKRLVARTGATENVYIAVFLMPDSSKLERRQIEEALVKTFNPYFNRGV